MIAQLLGWLGCNLKSEPHLLPPEVGVMSMNQRPGEEGDFRPWREPLAVTPAPVIPSLRLTLYRMGRDLANAFQFWLSWTTEVHVSRGFETTDPTERTYFTGAAGGPQWTDNSFGLGSAPYPGATRLLAVPQPTVAPTVGLVTDGPDGEPRRLYYCYTWVNDIGWESAPSPPTLAPLAKPGAILSLSTTETVPAGNYGVNRIRWYRTQTTDATGGAEFFFIREYAISASGMQDDARALGVDVLPTDAATLRLALPANAKFLTNCSDEVACALVNRTIRYCEPTLIYAWPLAYEYTLFNTPVGVASFAGRELVLTTGGAELMVGDDAASKQKRKLDFPVCVSSRSIVTLDYACAWAAADGLWHYSSDGNIRNLVGNILTEKQWAALVPATMHCYRLELGSRLLIIGFYNDGASKGFVIDPQNDKGIYFLSAGYTTAYWDALLRKLFVLNGSSLQMWDAGAAFMTATFRSKVHRQQAHVEGEWLELLSVGNVTSRVFTAPTENHVDPSQEPVLTEQMNRVCTTGQNRLPDGAEGRDWQLEISTQGRVVAATLE